ncbi:MAG: cytochrome b [Gammaproteobacteria bacterium]|nr:cytochrome b [Gammaproteobacteria bacterium]
MLKNTKQTYGSFAKVMHWLVALVVIAMFAVGFWMVTLDYYSEWYKVAPHYHKSVGILLAIIVVFRLLWRVLNPRPEALKSHAKWEIVIAHLAHWVMYILLFAIFLSGYLISTADGRAIEVFNWFGVPSMGEFIANQEDVAGEFHQYLAYFLIGLVLVHGAAALKHHFIDKDSTLRRMMWGSDNSDHK